MKHWCHALMLLTLTLSSCGDDGKKDEDKNEEQSSSNQVLALEGSSITYTHRHYDCGDMKPLPEPPLAGIHFESLSAVVPGMTQVLVTAKISEDKIECIYRARFKPNQDLKTLSMDLDQSLKSDGSAGCESLSGRISANLKNATIEYDKTALKWVALIIPAKLQTGAQCSLRAVFGPART